MTRLHFADEDPSYTPDSGVGYDSEGYILAPGNDAQVNGQDRVRKATGEDTFVGVNKFSSYVQKGHRAAELKTGEDAASIAGAVHQDGVVNVLCLDGSTYGFGDTISMSSTAGVGDKVADTDADSASDTVVGTVAVTTDLSSETEPGLVPVRITGYV